MTSEEMQAIVSAVADKILPILTAQVGQVSGTGAALKAAEDPGNMRHTIVKKKNGQEHASVAKLRDFNSLSDPELDQYMLTVYALRSKDDGVFFYGAAPVWSLMMRRCYIRKDTPFSPDQCKWIRTMLNRNEQNLAVLREKYAALTADLRKRNLTPLQIVETAEKARRESKVARKALLG